MYPRIRIHTKMSWSNTASLEIRKINKKSAGKGTKNLNLTFWTYRNYFCLIIVFPSVLRIRIHRIHKFLGLLDPDPGPLVRGMDPDPDPSIIKQK